MATLRSLNGLNDSNLMKSLREKKKQSKSSLVKGSKNVKNLMTTIDTYLLVWESENCTLLVKNLLNIDSNKDTKKDNFLTILLTDPPVFQVENVQVNMDGSLVVLSGPQGVACVELPINLTSLEAKANQQGPSEKIAKSCYIDEQLLTCKSRLRIQEVKFHPGSPTNSHVVILTSDNCIRVYDICHPSRPEKTILINAKISNMSAHTSLSGATFLSCPDEAVSFDFGPMYEDVSRNGRDTNKRELVPIFLFPVYVLLGNGDVYSFSCSVQSNSSRAPKIRVAGPMIMQPAALDNYSGDACSILCMPVSPPVLVIANRNGNIHHAVVLPRDITGADSADESDDQDDKRSDIESLLSKASLMTADSKEDSVLHVAETLELDGDILDDNDGLRSIDDNGDTEGGKLILLKDPACTSRYFVTHDYGVHAVVVPLVDTLAELAARGDQDVNSDETKRVMLAETVVEFILCSRMKTSAPAPPQGIVCYPFPPTLLVLLDSADIQVVSLSRLLKSAFKPTTTVSLTKVEKESFEALIRRQLQRTHSQPKLSLPPGTELPVAEVVKLFSRSVQTLREEYIMKQDAARELIERKSRLLDLHLHQQFDELSLVQQSKAELTNVAHQLAEKYEDAMEVQERMNQRVEKVLYEIQRRSPILTDAEKQMGQQLRLLESKVNTLRQAIDSLRRKEQLLGDKAAQIKTDPITGSHLSEEHRTSIHESLTQQSEEIATLMKTLQQTRKKLAA